MYILSEKAERHYHVFRRRDLHERKMTARTMQGKNWFGYDIPRLDQATRIDLIWQIKSYQDMDQELSSRVRHLDLSSEGPRLAAYGWTNVLNLC
jgi:hypothetical protein